MSTRTSISSPSTDYYNLGSYHRPVTCSTEEAQTWFDRGLIWSYGFNHQASIDCFEQALLHDPQCSMAYWGLAYALGPNYNKPWEVFDQEECRRNLKKAHRAACLAVDIASAHTAVEQAITKAIVYRYPQETDISNHPTWNKQYADAMEQVYKDFPDDLDVAALYADALMNLTPWSLWDMNSGLPADGARTLDIKAVLDRALSQSFGLEHPGLLHLYIHLMEMSSCPEAALPIADHLRGLVPDSGHLNHMPTHLDVLCGDYRRAVASNSKAIQADDKFFAHAGALNFYTLYRCHNYHFKIYAAMFAGQSSVALETVTRLELSLPEELLRIESPPMADWLEGFLAMRVHVLIRFGLWQNIIEMPFPSDQKLYCTTNAMLCYAKGVAYSATGALEKARSSRNRFLEATKNVPQSRTLFNNTCLDILAVASEMLNGELEYRSGNIKTGFEHLRKSIELEENLPYDEPWGWMQPSRHAYGALLLEQGLVNEAAAVYCADLGFDNSIARALQHPNNVWALHGYHECLQKLGRHAEALIIGKQLTLAIAVSDVDIASSCFCRLINSNAGKSSDDCCAKD